MISNNTRALAVDVVAPFLDGNNDGHKLPLVRGVIGRCTSQLLAIVGHGLQATPSLLQDHTTNAASRCISFNDKCTSQVGHKQYRSSTQCLLQLLKCSLLWCTPMPRDSGTQQVGQGCCNAGIVLDKALIKVAAAKEATELANLGRRCQLRDSINLGGVR